MLVRSYLFRARLVSLNVKIKHSRVYACNPMQFFEPEHTSEMCNVKLDII